MDNVVKLNLVEMGDDFRHDVQEVLECIPDDIKTIVVLGENEDGYRWYASNANCGQMIWLIEKIKQDVLSDD